MPFKRVAQKFPSSINEVTIGVGNSAITLGGENIMPLYCFDAPLVNRPCVGMEISDCDYDATLPQLAAFYAGTKSVIERAQRAAQMEGADFLVLKLTSADPNGQNASVEQCVALCREVVDAINIPLAIEGCKHIEKDKELFEKLAEALQENNVLFLSAREENYKSVAVAAGLAFKQKLGAESAVDINLAKQLNVLISQLGVKPSSVVMNLGAAAVGYGFEYVASTIDRVKIAALAQNDQMLQLPVVTPVAAEAWSVKEAMIEASDMPEWGEREQRGIRMEIMTAAACLAAGSNAVILSHPRSVSTIAALIGELM